MRDENAGSSGGSNFKNGGRRLKRDILQILDTEIFDEPAWYGLRTQPKHEHIAAANLGRNLGLEVFNPRLRLERATRRGVVRVIEPLFPCYLFVRCALSNRLDEIRHALEANPDLPVSLRR